MNQYDFGYSWPWTHGHLVVAAVFGLIGLTAYRLKWRRWILAIVATVALWAIAAYLILHFQFNLSSPMDMPTTKFLATADSPAILDVGAGSGRTTIMALASRPKSTVTSLDIFSSEFGIPDNSEARLLANVKAAGFEGRAKPQRGDMRKIPLADGSFDGVVSAYAIDHLNGEGVRQSLAEVRRVLKPQGEFLLMVINRDGWVKFTYPLLHGHYYGQAPAGERWRRRLNDTGFVIMEEGTPPGTLYLLCRKKPASTDGENKNDSR